MHNTHLLITFFLFSILALPAFASNELTFCESEECVTPLKRTPHIVAIDPAVSYLRRTKEGGTTQTGLLYGIRGSYDYIKRYKPFFEVQASIELGSLKGHTKTNALHSKWQDEMAEANLGYTLQYKMSPYYSFTPFIGGGYMREANRFTGKEAIQLKFITAFPYLSCGFLSSVCFENGLRIGLNFRVKTPWDINCKVENDPEYKHISLIVNEKQHYRAEMPISYHKTLLCGTIEMGIAPYYELRQYGRRENYPFDFLKTKIELIGCYTQFIYRFRL